MPFDGFIAFAGGFLQTLNIDVWILPRVYSRRGSPPQSECNAHRNRAQLDTAEAE